MGGCVANIARESRTVAKTRLIFPGRGATDFVLLGPLGMEKLSPRQATILLYFCALAPGSTRSAMEICEMLWPNPDRMPEWWMNCLGMFLLTLRRKLAAVGADIAIANFRGRGYGIGSVAGRI